jgi:hypothetical protein
MWEVKVDLDSMVYHIEKVKGGRLKELDRDRLKDAIAFLTDQVEGIDKTLSTLEKLNSPDMGYKYHYGQMSGGGFEEALKASLSYKKKGRTRNDQLVVMLGNVTGFLGTAAVTTGKVPVPTQELRVMKEILEAMMPRL